MNTEALRKKTETSLRRNIALTRIAVVGLSIMLISACDSDGSTSTTGALTPTPPPNISASLDVPALMARTTASTTPADLLINGSFEQDLSGWQSCSPNPKPKIVSDATDGSKALLIKKQNCIQQGVAINSGETLIFSCDVKMKSNRNDWSGLGLSFYDEFWNFIDEPAPGTINGNTYSTYSVTGVAPDNARNVAVWLYTENQVIADNCQLQKVTEPPPPPPPVYGNLLTNAEFDEGGETALGWSDRCNGNYQRSSSFGNSIIISSGACVHHRPGNDVLAALQGNYFAYSCEYTKSSDSYASIATNLTTRRDETGQNDVAILPRTYFGGVPSWQFETVTLYGKAKDYLEPGDIFVSIGDQGSSGLLVLGCSLEIVSGQTYTIGDTGPAGGIVFSVTNDGMHGLEAAPTDVDGEGGLWCSSNVLQNNTSSSDIEGMDNLPNASVPDSRTGKYNTDRITLACGGDEVLATKARGYIWPDGQSGGFLPNKEELNLLYQQRHIVGGFSQEAGLYASSTEAESSTSIDIWAVAFFVDNGATLLQRKDVFSRGRSVRSF